MSEKKDLSYFEYWLTKDHWNAYWGIKLFLDYMNYKRAWESSDSYEDMAKAFSEKIAKEMYEGQDSGFMLHTLYDSTKHIGSVDFDVRGINVYGSEVKPKEFIEWMYKKGYPLPYEFQVHIGVQQEDERFTQRDEHRLDKAVIQGIGATLWDIYSDMTAEEMQYHHAIQVYGGGKDYEGTGRVKIWLREVDQRIKKRGRKRKQT